MRLALFDLDNTLLGGDSDHAWGDYLCRRGILDGEFYQDYLAGTLDNDAYLNFSMAIFGRTERVTACRCSSNNATALGSIRLSTRSRMNSRCH